MNPTTLALSVRELSKRFGTVTAVDGVSFDVSRGEFVVLVGPSGCGKSTLLRLICGLDVPDAGTVDTNGVVLSGNGHWVPPERRPVGLVFQDNALLPHLTVKQNVEFGMSRWTRVEKRDRMHEVLALTKLGTLANRYPHELSGGQQQRVALARALAPRPETVLLDEPFSDLDRALRTEVREELRSVLKSSGTAAVLVTHDQDEALALGDRIMIQCDGRIEQIGTPEDVFVRPATKFVAAFMGETYFIPGTVTASGISTELGNLEQSVALAPGTEIEVAIRPDDLSVSVDGGENASVVSCAFTGMLNLYELRLTSGRILRSAQPHTRRLSEGSRVRVAASPGHGLACFPL